MTNKNDRQHDCEIDLIKISISFYWTNLLDSKIYFIVKYNLIFTFLTIFYPCKYNILQSTLKKVGKQIIINIILINKYNLFVDIKFLM